MSIHAPRGANAYEIVFVPGVKELDAFPVNQIDGINGTNKVANVNSQA